MSENCDFYHEGCLDSQSVRNSFGRAPDGEYEIICGPDTIVVPYGEIVPEINKRRWNGLRGIIRGPLKSENLRGENGA